MRTHGGLTEGSRTDSLNDHIGKGREGKGIGREAPLTSLGGSSEVNFQNQVQSVTREDWTWR